MRGGTERTETTIRLAKQMNTNETSHTAVALLRGTANPSHMYVVTVWVNLLRTPRFNSAVLTGQLR